MPGAAQIARRARSARLWLCAFLSLSAFIVAPAMALSPERAAEAAFAINDPQSDEAAAEALFGPEDAVSAAPANLPDAPAADGKAKPKTRDKNKRKRAAQDDAPAASAAPAQGRAAPPLFRIADEDTELWLLGSFHILPPGLDWRSPALGRALDGVDEIWFEAEVDTRQAQETTVRILKEQGFNRSGARLTALLSPEAAAKLGEVAGELSLPLDALERMRPWQAFLTLSVQFIVAKGFDPGSGLEAGLLAEARARGRDLAFLETVEQQLSLFTQLKPKVEASLLELTLAEWETQSSEFDALFEAWRAGDVETIDRLMNAPMRERSPEVYEVLLRGRNIAWAERLKAAMGPPGRRLVAVGAGHLAGPDSVQALMRAAGFAVERYGETGPLAAPANDNAPDLNVPDLNTTALNVPDLNTPASDAAASEPAGPAPDNAVVGAAPDDDLGALIDALDDEAAADLQ